MEIQEFIEKFREELEIESIEQLNADTDFHQLDEWSSLTGMSVIAMARTQYGKTITGKEIRECETVKDLFNLIASK